MGKLTLSTMVVALLFSATSISVVNAQLPPEIPREETVIASFLSVMSDPYSFNPFVPGHQRAQGWHQCLLDVLWEINVSYGQYINELARAPPKPLDENFTKWRIYLREGVYWSDGVEFTSEDVVFTLKMLASTPGLTVYAFWNRTLKDVVAVDKYIVDLELTKPFAKIQNYLGCQAYTVDTVPVPKHIWKGQDPIKFKFYPPVGTGTYILKDIDPNGYWALWEKRSDWQRSSIGRQGWDLSKAPKYILYINYGTKDKFILEMTKHNLDIMFQFTPDEWETVRQGNSNATAWYGRGFPWGLYDDGCTRDVAFNLDKYPFNITDVRWALALSLDIVDLSISWYRGLAKITPVPLTVYGRQMELYHLPIREWLINNFTLPDGYKPFDPDIPLKMANAIKSQLGYEVPTKDLNEAIDLFGIGWWKHDPEKAAELLRKNGFTKDATGKWLLPKGEPWALTLYAAAGDPVTTRQASVMASQWNEFGIQVKVQELQAAVLGPATGTGDFEATASSYVCNSPLDDVWAANDAFNPQYATPIGTFTTVNAWRYRNPEIQTVVDQLASLPPDDPAIPAVGLKGFKILIRDMAMLMIGAQIRIMPYDTTYWRGWPIGENPYNNAACHRSAATYIYANLKPATEEIPTPPTPPVTHETIEEIRGAVGNLTQKVTDLSASVSRLQTTVSQLQTSVTQTAAQVSMVNTVMALSAVDLVIAIVAIVLVLKRR